MTKQYRPYFTPAELICIHDSLRIVNTPESLALAKKLDMVIYKIRSESITPSNSLSPSIDQKLGISPLPKSHMLSSAELNDKFLSGQPITSVEYDRVLEYRYENDLMSPEEEAEFEKKLGI